MPVLLIFAMLCAWEGSQWLTPGLALGLVPFAWTSAASFSVVAIVAALWRQDRAGARNWSVGRRLASWGALALGVPAMLLAVAQRYFAGEVAVAALAGVPVVVVVAAQVSGAAEDGAEGALLPAVAGLAGALLLIPVRLPASRNGWIGFALDLAAVVLAGSFGVLGHRAAQAERPGTAVLWVASGNAVALAAIAGLLSLATVAQLRTFAEPGAGAIAGALVAGVLTAGAASMLLRGLPPLKFAARFLLVPLLGAVEAYLMLRPTLSFRALAGAALMAAAAVLLLRSKSLTMSSVVPARASD